MTKKDRTIKAIEKITKLEWMAGQVVSGMYRWHDETVQQTNIEFAHDVVRIAEAILNECERRRECQEG